MLRRLRYILVGFSCLVFLEAVSVENRGRPAPEGVNQPISASGYSEPHGPIQEIHFSSATRIFDHGDPTDFEQLMLQLVNRARAHPSAEAARFEMDLNEGLSSDTITDIPKQPLAFHPLLIEAARGHSQWMLDHDTFSHEGANGSSPGDRIEATGFVFSGSWTWGENVAWGGSSGNIDMEAMTLDRHEGLFRSPGHRVNIFGENFDEVGIGIKNGVFTQNRDWNAIMVTQKFVTTQSTVGPLILGSVFHDRDEDGFYDPGEGLAGVEVEVIGGEWKTYTSHSGGYALPYSGSEDTLQLQFSGGGIFPAQSRTIQTTGKNIEQNLAYQQSHHVAFTSAGLTKVTSQQYRITVEGVLGTVFELQGSTDLKNWTTIETQTLLDVRMEWIYEKPTQRSFEFFRLQYTTD